LKNDVKESSKSIKQKIIYGCVLKVTDENSRGTLPKCHGSATLVFAK
jgi:hypothetical protein